MPTSLVRMVHKERERWAVAVGDRLAPLEGDYPSTRALIEAGEADWRAAAGRPTLDRFEVRLLSPVTTPARVLCQGANYRQHRIESGLDPDAKHYNMFFQKSDAAIQGPAGSIVRPAHVRLLDYEIELAIVFRRAITAPITVTSDTLADHVFGITIANDVSARDVQLRQTQFFKGKSYRGFCPLGPTIVVLDRSEMRYLDELLLTLEVDGRRRQHDSTANLVFKPAETITELSTFSNVSPRDVLLTGTPAGCALRAPPRAVRNLMQLLLSEAQLWATFTRMQARRAEYLRPGESVRATIRSADGVVDLGEQHHLVEEAS